MQSVLNVLTFKQLHNSEILGNKLECIGLKVWSYKNHVCFGDQVKIIAWTSFVTEDYLCKHFDPFSIS